ncbi:DUF350 domain-containing protein [Woeseiaceae bacterium]|nr:DUF350 domain-containing protein [Woeseiaceae bacterium]
MDTFQFLEDFIAVLFYSGLGLGVFILAFLIMVRISPFSVVKEIEVDQNISLAILFGSVFISLAIVIAAALS